MQIEFDRAVFDAAGKMQPHVQLCGVRTVRVEANNTVPFITTALEHAHCRIDTIESTLVFIGGSKLVASASIVVRIGDATLDLISIAITIGVEYDLPSPPIPEEYEKTNIPAFVKVFVLYHAWPYLREMVQRLAASMLFPITLPLLVLKVKEEKVEEKKYVTTKRKKKS